MSLPSVLGKDPQCDAWFNTDAFKEMIHVDFDQRNLDGFRWVWSKCGDKIINGNIIPNGTPMTYLDYTNTMTIEPAFAWFKTNVLRILKRSYGLKTSQEVLGLPPSGGRRKNRGSRKQRKQSRGRKQTKRR